MPVYSRTYFDLKKEIARLADDLERSGTLTSGSATTAVDTVNFIDATNARLLGINFYVGNGAGQSREVRATAFTAATDTLTIPSGTALDNTSEYMLTRRFTNSDIVTAIRAAIDAYGKYANPWTDQSLIYGSPLNNATFYDNSGTFPNGWTRTGTGGTFAQESTISKHGRFSASIVSDGTNAAGIRQDVLNVGRYRGLAVRARAWILANTLDRVEFRIDDGIDTTTGLLTLPTANQGWGTAERETPALTVSDRATRLRVTIEITAGSAITIYASGVYITPLLWTEWNIPAGTPNSIHLIRYENGRQDEFGGEAAANSIAEIVRETTRRIRLKRPNIRQGSILELQGRNNWADFSTAATDDDTTFDGSWSWVAYEAAANLWGQKMDGSREHEARHRWLLERAAEYRKEQQVVTRPLAGSILVEAQ